MAIFITGMHRSGTSLATRVLNILGMHVGDTTSLIAPSHNNPRGYWENREVRALNDAILHHLGGTWDAPPLLPLNWHHDPSLNDYRRRALSLLATHYPDPDPIALKDPRFSLLLPFWQTVLPIDATILCIRHPAEVASSLAKRNSLHPSTAAELWLTYICEAFKNSAGALLLSYDQWFDDIDSTSYLLADFANLPTPDPQQIDEVRSFFSPQLRRSYQISTDSPELHLAEYVYHILCKPQSGHPNTLLEGVGHLLRQQRANSFQLTHLRAALQTSNTFGKGQETLASMQAQRAGQQERDLSTMREQLRQTSLTHHSDVRTLTGWITRLQREYRLLIQSRRWRLGATIGDILRPLSKKRTSQSAPIRMHKIFSQYEQWISTRIQSEPPK